MDAFGDLSGIVYNVATGHVVGGHQRIKHLPPEAEITIVETFDTPTKQGTVAHGYIELNGEQWAYREVQWGAEEEMIANIGANRHGGFFKTYQVAEILSVLDGQGFPDISLAGYTDEELEDLIAPDEDDEEKEGQGSDLTTCPECGHEWSKGK